MVSPIGLNVIVYDPTSRGRPSRLRWSAVTTYVYTLKNVSFSSWE